MAFGRNGHLGVCVHSHVVEAKELGQGHVYLPSMGEDHVMDLKHNINHAILHSALVSLYSNFLLCYSAFDVGCLCFLSLCFAFTHTQMACKVCRKGNLVNNSDCGDQKDISV